MDKAAKISSGDVIADKIFRIVSGHRVFHTFKEEWILLFLKLLESCISCCVSWISWVDNRNVLWLEIVGKSQHFILFNSLMWVTGSWIKTFSFGTFVFSANISENGHALIEFGTIFTVKNWEWAPNICGLRISPICHVHGLFFPPETAVIQDKSHWCSSSVYSKVFKHQFLLILAIFWFAHSSTHSSSSSSNLSWWFTAHF